MKGRDLLVIGGFVVIGVFAYEIYKHLKEDKEFLSERVPHKKADFPSEQFVPLADTFVPPVKEIQTAKETVIHSIKDLHHKASVAMEESLTTIFGEHEDVTISDETREALNNAKNDLNDLLK